MNSGITSWMNVCIYIYDEMSVMYMYERSTLAVILCYIEFIWLWMCFKMAGYFYAQDNKVIVSTHMNSANSDTVLNTFIKPPAIKTRQHKYPRSL